MHNTTIDVILVCNIWIGEPEMTNYTLTASCALISVVMLLLTVVVYILVPTLRDLQVRQFLVYNPASITKHNNTFIKTQKNYTDNAYLRL